MTLALGASLAGCTNPSGRLALPRGNVSSPSAFQREPTPAEKSFWDRLGQARVIYIGETHNSNSDHEYQFDVLKGLKSRGIQYAIGWEMFDVTQQSLLDQWQARQLSTDALLDRTNWRRHWGSQSVMYETMLRWSLPENVPNLALNAPSTLSHKVAYAAALTAEERALLPEGFQPLPGGLDHFNDQMAHAPHAGITANSENFYKAQLVWEQTMASRVLGFLEAHPDSKLVVLVGRGHLEGGFGIPAFVRQRSGVRQLVLFPGGALPSAVSGSLARNGQNRITAWTTDPTWNRSIPLP